MDKFGGPKTEILAQLTLRTGIWSADKYAWSKNKTRVELVPSWNWT